MATPKPEVKKERSITLPLIIVAGVLVVIGIVMLLVGKVAPKDPTMTAAPVTGTPGQQIYHASAGKLATEQGIVAQQKAQMEAFKAAHH